MNPAIYAVVAVCLVVIGLIVGTSCSSAGKIPASGSLHDYALATTVDDATAKYYLENYLAGRVQDADLHRRLEKMDGELGNAVPTREQLKAISREFSVDTAALVFGDQLLKQPANAPFQKQFLANLEKVRGGLIEYPGKDVLILLVPGFDYVKNGRKTGADFARPKQLLEQAGYEVQLVAIDPLGGVEENAAFLARSIASHPQRRIALAGASSAGPAIHLALGKLIEPGDSKNVKAWLNLGGILQGVPVLDQFSSGPKGWLFSTVVHLKGWKPASFASMRTQVSRSRFATLSVPSHIVVCNYVGLSLSGDISRFARDKYSMMRADGPNDGLTLLPDILPPNSLSILAPRSDHFFAEDREIARGFSRRFVPRR